MSNVDRRLLKINKRVQQALGTAILTTTGNPLFKTVSITRVETARDYKTAKVYFSSMAEEMADELKKALQSSEGYFRQKVSDAVKLPYTPHLRFIFDRSLIDAQRVMNLMDQLKEEDGQ